MDLGGMRVASLVDEQFEDLELWYPTLLLRGAGVDTPLIGPAAGAVYHGKYGVPAVADIDWTALDAAAFDGVLIPGGWAPDKLRRYPEVLAFVAAVDAAGKLVAHICHAGWVVASAKICGGRTMTSTPGIKDDLIHAGATWIDQEVVVDANMVSSRRPPDLPAYGNAILGVLAGRR